MTYKDFNNYFEIFECSSRLFLYDRHFSLTKGAGISSVAGGLVLEIITFEFSPSVETSMGLTTGRFLHVTCKNFNCVFLHYDRGARNFLIPCWERALLKIYDKEKISRIGYFDRPRVALKLDGQTLIKKFFQKKNLFLDLGFFCSKRCTMGKKLECKYPHISGIRTLLHNPL